MCVIARIATDGGSAVRGRYLGNVKSLGAFLEGDDKVLVCTQATFRFAVDAYGVEAFDDRLIAVDEFHHVSANPDKDKMREVEHIIKALGGWQGIDPATGFQLVKRPPR